MLDIALKNRPDKAFTQLPPDTLIADNSLHDLTVLYRNHKMTEFRLELATQTTEAGLWSLDLGSKVFWANERGRDIFNFPAQAEITWQQFISRVHPDDRQTVQDAVNEALGGKKKLNVEYRIVQDDGTLHWILSNGALYSFAGEKNSCLMGVSVDITGRKETDQSVVRQIGFETLMMEISATLAKLLPLPDIDNEIDLALQKLMLHFEGDRCGLIQYFPESRKSLITHVCYRDGFEHVPADTDLVSMFPWAFMQVLNFQDCFFSSPEELPPEAAVDRANWEVMGVKSGLHISLGFIDGGRYVILIQSLTRNINWPQEIRSRLQVIGEVFINALFRKNIEESLKKSCHEIQQLKDKLQQEAECLRAEIRLSRSHDEIIGQSESIKKVLAMVEQVAPTGATVLVSGETGTGKELMAQAIHNHSSRRNSKMVKVNCASLPSSLIESELFGRERGAYTGALTRQIGRFELADKSTIFLDEIGELSLELQSKLLRVLQEGEFERLGSPKTIKVDVRVIAATNRNLPEEVRKGNFREDLYYRLNVFPITLPPLRQHLEDIPMLVWEFVKEFNEKMGKKIHKIPKSGMAQLQSYSWPGNIRELRNVIEHAFIVTAGDELKIKLPETNGDNPSLMITFEEMERRHISDVLRQTGWRIKGDGGAAQVLGLNPATLYSRMKKLNISAQREKDDISH